MGLGHGHSHGASSGGHGGAGRVHGASTPEQVEARRANRRRLTLALTLALSYAAIEAIGGWWTGSLALLADALHMVSDVAALALSLLAIWMAGRPPSGRRTFGHSRAEILAALANGLALALVALFITTHAIERFRNPTEVAGAGVMGVALGGLVINLVGLAILEGGRSESLNVRGAWLHVLSDTLASVGVIIAGAGIWLWGWHWLDPAVSLVVSALVLYSAWHLIREALDVLMEAVPSHLDPEEIRATLLSVGEVRALHCLHVWMIGSSEVSLSSHLVVGPGRDADALLQQVRSELSERFGIEHTTIQIELAEPGRESDLDCADACEPVAQPG